MLVHIRSCVDIHIYKYRYCLLPVATAIRMWEDLASLRREDLAQLRRELILLGEEQGSLLGAVEEVRGDRGAADAEVRINSNPPGTASEL